LTLLLGLLYLLARRAIAECQLDALDAGIIDHHLRRTGLPFPGAQAGGFLGRKLVVSTHTARCLAKAGDCRLHRTALAPEGEAVVEVGDEGQRRRLGLGPSGTTRLGEDDAVDRAGQGVDVLRPRIHRPFSCSLRRRRRPWTARKSSSFTAPSLRLMIRPISLL